ncbi:5-oxoprolinase subunit PxpB [Yeosuana marina]|uniref:5-oxoprolinase subunit PxpB n=1 Tax=Yeosuana marina TaxID=1565536 RepID=UPI001421159C|nr:5-oxoprolinase subunit PxpB [Yeosuana marina]
MPKYQLTYKPYGERAILIEWPSIISEAILYDILAFKKAILKDKQEEGVELNSAYRSLIVIFKDTSIDFKKQIHYFKNIYTSLKKEHRQHYKLWKIPVCYHPDFGIDLECLSQEKKISIESIIEAHTKGLYTVYFIGFLPGFLYLGGLDELLWIPRKGTPRLTIEKGSVGIGGNQTGIYPKESPGGWNIIGNAPIDFFNIQNDIPCFASPGDKIQCIPISKKEHQDVKILVEAGVYQIESEVIHD